jgi:hypothetical protein
VLGTGGGGAGRVGRVKGSTLRELLGEEAAHTRDVLGRREDGCIAVAERSR